VRALQPLRAHGNVGGDKVAMYVFPSFACFLTWRSHTLLYATGCRGPSGRGGANVGKRVGAWDGVPVGSWLGLELGDKDEAAKGEVEGVFVGFNEGDAEGVALGLLLGVFVGFNEGEADGVALGLLLGDKDGAAEEGAVDGLPVTGALVGACEGATVDAESVGDKDGVLLGVSVCPVAVGFDVGLEVVSTGAMEGMVVGAVVVGQTPVFDAVVGPVLVTKTSLEPLLGRNTVPEAVTMHNVFVAAAPL